MKSIVSAFALEREKNAVRQIFEGIQTDQAPDCGK